MAGREIDWRAKDGHMENELAKILEIFELLDHLPTIERNDNTNGLIYEAPVNECV